MPQPLLQVCPLQDRAALQARGRQQSGSPRSRQGRPARHPQRPDGRGTLTNARIPGSPSMRVVHFIPNGRAEFTRWVRRGCTPRAHRPPSQSSAPPRPALQRRWGTRRCWRRAPKHSVRFARLENGSDTSEPPFEGLPSGPCSALAAATSTSGGQAWPGTNEQSTPAMEQPADAGLDAARSGVGRSWGTAKAGEGRDCAGVITGSRQVRRHAAALGFGPRGPERESERKNLQKAVRGLPSVLFFREV